MKIAMIGHKRIPSREGGIEIVVGELSKRMASLGHEVVAYNRKSEHIAGKGFDTEGHSKEWKNVKIKWIYTPNSSKLNAIVYSAFSTIRAIFGRYDVLHFHAEGPSAMVLLAKLFGKRCVVTIHGLDWQRSKWGGFATKFLLLGERIASKYADEIIVLSKNVQDYFLETYNRETTFIPNGVNKATYREPEIIKERYGLNGNDYILFLGRLVPEKGIHYLIEAYSRLKTDKKLVIAGGSSHTSEYRDELIRQAEDNKSIIFTGFTQGKELEELFSNSYIYCLPSDLEGMPISLLEAMSYGSCCLTSDISECTEVCADNAIYFEKGGVDSLTEKLAYLLENEGVVQEYKNTTKQYISKYNWDDVTRETLELYERKGRND